MIIIIGNLTYQLMVDLYGIFSRTGKYNNFHLSILAFLNAIGIVGVLWLLRSYKRSLRMLRKQKEDEERKKNEQQFPK
jgi:type VI protein secretion system component VasK